MHSILHLLAVIIIIYNNSKKSSAEALITISVTKHVIMHVTIKLLAGVSANTFVVEIFFKILKGCLHEFLGLLVYHYLTSKIKFPLKNGVKGETSETSFMKDCTSFILKHGVLPKLGKNICTEIFGCINP